MFYAFHKTCIFFEGINMFVVLLNKPLLWNLEFFPNWLSPFSWSSPERLSFPNQFDPVNPYFFSTFPQFLLTSSYDVYKTVQLNNYRTF